MFIRYHLPEGHPDKFTPYAEIDGGKHLVDVLVYIMTWMKPWIRVNRVKRDFPNQNVEKGEIGSVGGSMMTNLRQKIEKGVAAKGLSLVIFALVKSR